MFDWGITSAEYGIGGGGGNGRDNHMFPPWAREVSGKINQLILTRMQGEITILKKTLLKVFLEFLYWKNISKDTKVKEIRHKLSKRHI